MRVSSVFAGMQTATLPELLKTIDVSNWLAMSERRVARLAKRGRIPAIVLPDGELAFEPEKLAEWIRTQPAATEGTRDA